MKIFNHIAHEQLELSSNLIELSLDWIELNWIELSSNSIKEKWNAHWCTQYWKYFHQFHHHDYGIKKKIYFKK
jgi:hypothetical protein